MRKNGNCPFFNPESKGGNRDPNFAGTLRGGSKKPSGGRNSWSRALGANRGKKKAGGGGKKLPFFVG